MRLGTLITSNDLELPCVILPTKRQLFPVGKEVMAYCQHRLVKGMIPDDSSNVFELEVFVDWCIIPELEEMLCEQE